MKVDKQSMLLYAVTDRAWLGEQSLAEQVEQTIQGGATFIQLREKNLPYEDFLKEAQQIKKITEAYNVPFVINDNVEVAIACAADGIHIGQDDMDLSTARNMIGGDKILGVSVQTVEQARLAEKGGADYVGVGAVFTTSTKLDATALPLRTLEAICQSVSIPVVAIGGINEKNILQLSGSGIDGVAVVSAIFAKQDIKKASQELLALSKQIVNHENN
ncbi:thiamine phosphate synthase [Peribacillus asahii]|uniref:Thiamine-phosphate synthase n=1 Tax=Peribacillus asahii TaxID=228899 RepID=A0A3T0KUH8_9BACI|nr:thiamine phosphate synthase [Peribacillus asahii]AZV43950.1 thiamine-phosphate synthase [Peribacillus asahii]USK83693.1 thiamine phosphate synthase [Peribacillus asahii]